MAGEEAWDEPATSRVAFAKFRGTAIELIEPVQGASGAREWLAANGEGMQHIGVWVRDLPTTLARLDGQIEITYSPVALHPALAGRPAPSTLANSLAPSASDETIRQRRERRRNAQGRRQPRTRAARSRSIRSLP
jgi:hypothetical protein